MNCDILKKDIAKLKTLRDQFEQKANIATETGTGKIEAISIQKEAEQESDQLLEKYLDDFFDKNPNLLQIEFGERIKNIDTESRDGYKLVFGAIAPLPNGNMLIGTQGRQGLLYEYQKQPDGSYQLGERIEGFEDSDGNRASVFTIAPLPNGNMLIGGVDALYEYQKQPDGSYQLGKLIKDLKNKENGHIRVCDILPLSNGNALIRGDYTLYEYQKQPDGSYRFSDFNIKFKTGVSAAAPLPNGNLLFGSFDGALYEYQQQPDGSYRLSDIIKGFQDGGGVIANVYAIAPLPNGNMLIGGSRGALYEYQQQSDGSYKLGNPIEGFKTKKGDAADVYAIAPLPNGNMLIGGIQLFMNTNNNQTVLISSESVLKASMVKMVNKPVLKVFLLSQTAMY